MAKFKGSVVTGDLHGKAGTVVFVTQRNGIAYIRPRTVPRNPQTPNQQAARARLREANQTLALLTPGAIAAWRAFAQEIDKVTRSPLGLPSQSFTSIFVGLASKWLQLRDFGMTAGPVPLEPPGSIVVGDNVQLAASRVGHKIRVSASHANALGMATELLLQPLASAIRSPKDGHYRTATFVTFTPGALSVEIDVNARWVAVAYRFVALATGQATPLVPLGIA